MTMLPCDCANCENEAHWRPVLVLTPWEGAIVTEVFFSLNLCDACKAKTGPDELITEEGWEILCAEFDKRRQFKPTRSLTTVRFTEIGKGVGIEGAVVH